MLDFIKDFFCVCWDDHVGFFTYSNIHQCSMVYESLLLAWVFLGIYPFHLSYLLFGTHLFIAFFYHPFYVYKVSSDVPSFISDFSHLDLLSIIYLYPSIYLPIYHLPLLVSLAKCTSVVDHLKDTTFAFIDFSLLFFYSLFHSTWSLLFPFFYTLWN